MLNLPSPHLSSTTQLPQSTHPATIHPLGQRNAELVTPLGYRVASGDVANHRTLGRIGTIESTCLPGTRF